MQRLSNSSPLDYDGMARPRPCIKCHFNFPPTPHHKYTTIIIIAALYCNFIVSRNGSEPVLHSTCSSSVFVSLRAKCVLHQPLRSSRRNHFAWFMMTWHGRQRRRAKLWPHVNWNSPALTETRTLLVPNWVGSRARWKVAEMLEAITDSVAGKWKSWNCRGGAFGRYWQRGEGIMIMLRWTWLVLRVLLGYNWNSANQIGCSYV